MKLKVCSILTAVILVLSQGMSVNAAMTNPMTEPFAAQNNGARSTQYFSFQGNSYTTTYEGVQCRCSISGQSVTAGTDKSNSTVTVTSKSYNSLNDVTANGSNGGAAANTVTINYNATSYIKYTYQEHGAPYDTTVQIMLIRY
ncbi:MAG: hypothetical protein HDR21_06465 [Lachnospiraceae bacterium]|nr:hypothetical protein [Lachnospiraceae bacterium]MBD5481957.1 hypothetical protein [Lachnospiraceae bacterium]